MNQQADPCDDFFEFSCGNFDNNKKRDPDHDLRISFELLGRNLDKSIAGPTFYIFIKIN